MIQRTTVILAALLLCLCAGGCSHQGTTTPTAPMSTTSAAQGASWSAYETLNNYASQHGTVVYQVTYQPNAVVFDEKATENALKGISADGTQYAIDAGAPEAGALKPGSVLFLYGITIRKITSVTRQGSNLVLTTADADITDAIKDGHISWSVPIDPGVLGLTNNMDQSASQPQSLESIFANPALADTWLEPANKWTFSVGGNQDKCKFDTLFGWANPVLTINFHTVCNPQAFYTTLDGTCTIHGPILTGLLDIKGGVIERIQSSLEDLSLHADFDWTTYTQHTSPITLMDRQVKIKLAELPPIPLPIGGLPFALEVSTTFLIHPAFTGRQEVASGHFTINLGGGAGVSSNGSSVLPQGKVTGTQSIDHGTGVVSARAMAFIAAVELPRWEFVVELIPYRYILDNIAANILKVPGINSPSAISVKPYAFANVVLSTAVFTNGAMQSTLLFLPPCQRAQFMVTVNAGVGVKLNLLGFNKYLTAINKMTGPKSEFAVAKPILKHPMTLFKNGIKCPGD